MSWILSNHLPMREQKLKTTLPPRQVDPGDSRLTHPVAQNRNPKAVLAATAQHGTIVPLSTLILIVAGCKGTRPLLCTVTANSNGTASVLPTLSNTKRLGKKRLQSFGYVYV